MNGNDTVLQAVRLASETPSHKDYLQDETLEAHGRRLRDLEAVVFRGGGPPAEKKPVDKRLIALAGVVLSALVATIYFLKDIVLALLPAAVG